MSLLLSLLLGCSSAKKDECEAIDAVARANAAALEEQNRASKDAGEDMGARMRLLATMLRKQDAELGALKITDTGVAERLAALRTYNLTMAVAADHAASSAEAHDLDAMSAASEELKAVQAKEASARAPLDEYCFGE